jgi:hypothetical protein
MEGGRKRLSTAMAASRLVSGTDYWRVSLELVVSLIALFILDVNGVVYQRST